MKTSIILAALCVMLAIPCFSADTNEVEVSFTVVVISTETEDVTMDFLNSRNIGSTNDIPEVRLSEWARQLVASKMLEEFELYKGGLKDAAVRLFLDSFTTSGVPEIVFQ